MQTERVETPQTVFNVWKQILDQHPEVVRQTAKVYANHPHGHPDDQYTEILPRERIFWSDTERSFWGQQNEVKAIGSRVEILPLDFNPEIDYSGAYRWFNEGDFLKIRPELERSFVFVDFESKSSQDLLIITLKALQEWEPDWYLLDSGGSFHLIIAELIHPEDLPKYFGQLITDVSRQMAPHKRLLFGSIGEYLIKNCADLEKIKLWTNDVYRTFGHIDETITTGRLVFPIDMRYIAHVLEALVSGKNNEGYLRVSSRYGSVPILIAEQVDRQIRVFEVENNPFDRPQLSLPGF